jgi:Hint domain
MIETSRDNHAARVTRRGMMASNIKAMGAILASAAVASVSPAHARSPSCFLKGTKILTVLGERNIEDLAIGDQLPTVFGGTRAIQWVARYRWRRSDSEKPWVKSARPVCIKRSAFAAQVPHADLYVTQRHSVLIDGVLIPAGSLINGTTIVLHAAGEHRELEFFHIKLETHDAIFAEGAPCETLLDADESASNFAEYFRTYGTHETQDVRCAPVVCNGALKELKSRFRSVMSPLLGPQKIDVIRDQLEQRALAAIAE